MCRKAAVTMSASEEIRKNAFNYAMSELERVKESEDFNDLLRQAINIKSELSMAALIDEDLWQGRADLVCFLPEDKIVIIDFKSGSVPFPLTKYVANTREYADVLNYLRSKGYHQQLNSYQRMLEKIFPRAQMSKGILLTSLAEIFYFDGNVVKT